MRITLLQKYSVFDGQNRLLATFGSRERFGSIGQFRMDNPRGRLLAENYDNGGEDDYRIVSPTGVIAHVSKGIQPDGFGYGLSVNFFGNDLDPLLVYCYVIAIDNMNRYLEYGNKYGGA
jgi:hypothetical protein